MKPGTKDAVITLLVILCVLLLAHLGHRPNCGDDTGNYLEGAFSQ